MNSLDFMVLITRPIVLLLLLFVCLGTYAESKNEEVVIIVPAMVKPYKDIVESIQKEFISNNRKEKIKVLGLNALVSSPRNHLQGKKLLIPIGSKAIDYCIKSKFHSPFIASFTTQSAFATFSATAASQALLRRDFVGGVSLEQPPKRLMQLAKLIKPNVKSIGVVLGPNSKSKSTIIRRHTAGIGSILNVADIKPNDNPVKKLRDVFEKSQLFIVFPDKANFNRSLARWVIALSYKHQVPVISYSKKYADAGVLLSLYSRPQQIGKQTAEIALSHLNHSSRRPGKLVSPKYFDLAVNASVKRALNLSFPPKEVLLEKLYRVAP